MKNNIILAILVVALPLVTWAVIQPQIRTTTVLCLGDSITMGVGGTHGGYRGYLKQMLGNRYELVTEAHKGWTTNQLLKVLPLTLIETKPNIVLLMLGTNDIYLDKFDSGLRNIPKIVLKILENNIRTKIVIVGLLPSEKKGLDVAFFNLGISMIASQMGYCVVMVNFNVEESQTVDGVHPNDKGYELMAKAWYKAIKEAQ